MRLLLLILLIQNIGFSIELAKRPKELHLQEWSSNSLNDGKINILFYVDPDKKDINALFSKLLQEKRFSTKIVVKIAILNLAATWKPNFIIEKLLEIKQQEFPDNIYLKDKDSLLVKAWNLKDNCSNILVFSKDGKVLFFKAGKLSLKEIKHIFKIIDDNL